MHDRELSSLEEESDRFHERATGRCPITWVDVDVLRPQALGAVVRVPVARDQSATVFATEVFASAREAPRQEAPRFVEPNRARQGDPWAGSPRGRGVSGRRSRYLRRRGYASVSVVAPTNAERVRLR